MGDDRSNEIRERAYRIWQSEGEPHGRDREHWEQAEREAGQGAETSGAGQPEGAVPQEIGQVADVTAADDVPASAPAAKPKRGSRSSKTKA